MLRRRPGQMHSLDPDVARKVRTGLERLCAEEGTALLVTSHDMLEVSGCAEQDRVHDRPQHDVEPALRRPLQHVGMAQRTLVGIIKATLHHPALLVLDDEVGPDEGPRPHHPPLRWLFAGGGRRRPQRVLRGWGNYFRYGHSSRKFDVVDRYVHERLAIFASDKHGLPGRNWDRRFTTAWFQSLGVYRLSGTVRRGTPHASR